MVSLVETVVNHISLAAEICLVILEEVEEGFWERNIPTLSYSGGKKALHITYKDVGLLNLKNGFYLTVACKVGELFMMKNCGD